MAALFLVALALIAGTNCSATRSTTTINEYPSLAQVEFLGVFSGLWSQSCSSSVLTSYHVLTLASCFSGILYSPEYRRIRAGATYRNTGGIISYVLRENNHPSFGVQGSDGDLSVVRLESQLTFSPVVQQAPIIYQDAQFPDSLPLIHVGWGTTTESVYQSDILLKVILYKYDVEQCAKNYQALVPPETVTNNMICATTTNWDESGFCNGDFGAPLYFDGIVIGIFAFGYGCTNSTLPTVSTSIAPYTNWIITTSSN